MLSLQVKEHARAQHARSVFNARGADVFNSFISGSGLTKCQLEGYSFTWAHPSAKKMSKLDRFLMTNGLLSSFPHISAISLDIYLSDHRPIFLREVIVDYGATPFRFYHSWLGLLGFDQMVMSTWNSIVLDDSNKMIRFKKKLQILKKRYMVDQGMVTDDILLSKMDLMKQLHDVQSLNNRDVVQK
nr:RNA-directed DNA polymerase, eukaryota [Tanacetum cinerariifolium]